MPSPAFQNIRIPGIYEKFAAVIFLASFLALWGASHSLMAAEETILSEDFSAESGDWKAIRRGGGVASPLFLSIGKSGLSGTSGACLEVRGRGINSALGGAFFFESTSLSVPGDRIAFRAMVRTNRITGHKGTAGNSLFFGFANFTGSTLKESEDDGFFSVIRANGKPTLVQDNDGSLTFASSPVKPKNADIDNPLVEKEWVEVKMEMVRTETGIQVLTEYNSLDFAAEFPFSEGGRGADVSSVIIAQGGGEDAPSDFDIANLEVVRSIK